MSRILSLSNGTRVEIGPDWVLTTLPCGARVPAHPNPESHLMALDLGYGGNVARLTVDHDPMHSIVCDAIGLPYSYSLMQAAGCGIDPAVAAWEEKAILHLQRVICRHRELVA